MHLRAPHSEPRPSVSLSPTTVLMPQITMDTAGAKQVAQVKARLDALEEAPVGDT